MQNSIDAHPKPLDKILSSSYLPALDGLRAIAVLIVIVYHLGYDSVPGDLGVTAFFVLSGFLITWLLLNEFRQTGQISLLQFYSRRVLRIVPAYYIFLILIYLEEHFRGYIWDPWLTISGFFYLVNYYNGFHGHPNTAIAHAWSLAVEQQFYLLWPLLLIFLLRKGIKVTAWTLGVIIGLVATLRSSLYLGFGVDHSYVYNAFETRFDCIAAGCTVAVLVSWPRFRLLMEDLSKSSLFPLITLLLLCYSRIGGSAEYHYSVGFTVDSLLLGLFMIQLLIMSGRPAWRWIDHPAMVYLGRISYSLYLYHLLALGIANRISPNFVGGRVFVSLFLCVLLASVSYWLVEVPVLRLRQRLAMSNKIHREPLDPAQHVTA